MPDFLLWHTLPEKERQEIAEHFKHLSPTKLSSLDLEVGAVFVQWILSLDSIEATDIKPCGNGVEMFLQNRRDNQREYLRFYTSAPPVNILYDILETLKGSDYKKARIYSLTAIGQNQHQASDQYPLFFEIVDGDRLTSRLVDVQRRLTQAPRISSSDVSRKRAASSVTNSESENKTSMNKTSRPLRPRPLILVTSLLVLIMIIVVIYFIATNLPINTPTPSATDTVTSTHTPTVTDTSTITLTPSQTLTPSITLTNSKTLTVTKTLTRTASPTLTRTPSRTIAPTSTRTPSRTIAPTSTRTPSRTIAPTSTRTATTTKNP